MTHDEMVEQVAESIGKALGDPIIGRKHRFAAQLVVGDLRATGWVAPGELGKKDDALEEALELLSVDEALRICLKYGITK